MIDEEKLKFFVSKVSIWDYFSMIEPSYKSLSVEEKRSLPNKYYSELDDRYFGKTSDPIFILTEILKRVFLHVLAFFYDIKVAVIFL